MNFILNGEYIIYIRKELNIYCMFWRNNFIIRNVENNLCIVYILLLFGYFYNILYYKKFIYKNFIIYKCVVEER